MITIDSARLARLNDPAVHLISGSGNGINGKADGCVMNWAAFLAGDSGAKDSHPCVDSAIRRFCIRLNDAPRFAEWRDELKPYAARVLNTASSPEVARQRAYMCADWAVRTIAPRAFDFWADAVPARADEARAWAEKLRACPAVTDAESAQAARSLARGARDAAADAEPNAAADAEPNAAADAEPNAAADAEPNAAADAEPNAYAAAAYAYAAAAYAYAAAAYAYAAAVYAVAAARLKAAAFSRSMWDESLAFLDRLIAVTEVAA